jgi:circadian clock protein KaiC
MLGGQGWYRSSSILISGTAGTGKTSILAAYINSAASRGERSIFFAFEESPYQLVRNMKSIGIDLEPWIKQGLVHISSTRPTTLGLEMHLVMMHRQMERLNPRHVVLDPLTNLIDAGQLQDAKALLLRIMDDMKRRGITSVSTVLGDAQSTATDLGISSMVDTWIALNNLAADGSRRRTLQVVKSRGMSHSPKITPFVITDRGMTALKV